MRESRSNCKSLRVLVLAAALLIPLSSLSQPAERLTGAKIRENTELVERQREIIDAAEAEAFGQLVQAYSDLFRQREKDDDNKKALADIQQRLSQAEVKFRSVAAAWARAWALFPDTAQFRPDLVKSSYERAMRELLLELSRSMSILQRDLDAAASDEIAAARRGSTRGRIRAAYLKATVAAEQWAAFEPSIEKEFLPAPTSSAAILPSGQFSTLLAHLAWLGDRVASLDPANPVVPSGIHRDNAKFVVASDRDAAFEEFRRLVRTGLLVQPGSHRPIEGARRTELAKVLESNFEEYLRVRGSQQGAYSSLWLLDDDRARLAKQIQVEIAQSPEYRISGYLSAGLEPSFKEYFLAAALAVSQSQLDFQTRFNKEYLGEGFWNTGLGQLLRANDFPGTGDAGYTEVNKRVRKAIAEGDVLVKAFQAAARAETPAQLKSASADHYKLLKSFGYIVEYKDKAGKPASSYRIPGTRRSLGHRIRNNEGDAKIPGASILDVITPKSVAITLASMVIPELGAAWLTSGAAAFTTTTGGMLAVRAIAEMGVGFYMDSAIEACEKGNKDKKLPGGTLSSSAAFLENCVSGKVDFEKLVLESVVLGSLLQVTGGKTSELLEWMNWRRQRGLNPDKLYKSIESRMRQDPGISEKIWEFVGDGIGLAQETAITEAFQMASEGRDFDINTMMSTLVNNMLSRKMAKYKESLANVIQRPDVPRIIKDVIENDHVIAQEVQRNHERRMAEQAAVRERYEAITRDTGKPGRKVFESLLNGDLTWTELKNLFASDPDGMGVVMQEVADRREHFFIKIIAEARKRSIEDVEAAFVKRVEAALKLHGGNREAARAQLDALEKRRQAELDLINAEIKTPGSKNPTSDIDRSSSSAFLRKNLIHLYEAHARWMVDGDLPTSAKAFDVNEYINVFPFITENAGLVREIKQQSTVDGQPHPDYMEAMSLSGAVQHMSPEQGARYIDARRQEVQKAIDEGRATQADMDQFNRIVETANSTLQTSRQRLRNYAERFAREEGKSADDPEIQLKAKEFMYDLRMKEIRDLQYQLSEIEARHGGNQKHPEAIRKRAEIERKMSLAMRDGIETYSYTVGLDIIVNRVQAAQKPKLDKDGKPVIGEDGKPEMEGLSVADRIEDPNFRLGDGGELSMYTEQDMRSVLNDQVMFIAEHINHFNSGHESTYLAGRGIGKYTERAFLAMKIMGLDIAEVRNRAEHDPTRRLLEISQSMAKLKNDPKGMDQLLASLTRQEPATPENGLAEVMYLVEQVIPGMDGLTGVVPVRADPRIEIVNPIGLNPYARPARNSAKQKELQRLAMLRKGAGAKVTADYIEQQLRFTQIEITALEEQVAEMQRLASQYGLLDWDKIRKLREQVAGLSLQRDSVLWNSSRSTTLSRINSALSNAEQQLERARSQPMQGDIHQILYQDPGSWAYRRAFNRLDWLRDRARFLQGQQAPVQQAREKEAALEQINLGGAWSCGRQNQRSLEAELQHQGQDVTGVLRVVDGQGQGHRVLLASTYIRGQLSGFWTDGSSRTEKLDLPVDDGPTRMMFEAVADPDGKQFQFTYAPRHPRSALSLKDVICKRGGANQGEAVEFMVTQQLPIPATSEFSGKLEPGEGWVQAVVIGQGGSKVRTGYVVLKGRQRVKSSLGSHLRLQAGAYTIVVRMAGRQHRQNISVAAGVLNEVQLNAGILNVKSTMGGGELRTRYRVFDPEDKTFQGELAASETGKAVALAPGPYTVMVGQATGFPVVLDVTLGAGESLEVEARWKALQLPSVSNQLGTDYVFLKAEVEGADSGDWRSVTGPHLVRSGNGAIVYVPEGTYSARVDGNRIISGLEAQ